MHKNSFTYLPNNQFAKRLDAKHSQDSTTSKEADQAVLSHWSWKETYVLKSVLDEWAIAGSTLQSKLRESE